MELRTDLTKRISEVQASLFEQVIKKGSLDEFRLLVQDKVDVNTVKNLLQ